MIKKIFFVISICFAFSCKKGLECEFKTIKRIFFDVGKQDGNISYYHHVVITNFDKECIDSATIISISSKYLDTLTQGKPVCSLKFYNTDNSFIKNETAQLWTEVDKHCLVQIFFEAGKRVPYKFRFYSTDGNSFEEKSTWQ